MKELNLKLEHNQRFELKSCTHKEFIKTKPIFYNKDLDQCQLSKTLNHQFKILHFLTSDTSDSESEVVEAELSAMHSTKLLISSS